MRVVITGATGNVGTALVRALEAEPSVTSIIGISRRRPEWRPDKVTWVSADVSRDPLEEHFDGAGAVVHLAWLLQPSRDKEATNRVNVDGSERVFAAAAHAGVPALIHASSVAAYSPPARQDEPVDESWPTDGIPTAYYSRQKVAAERRLDRVEAEHPELRVVRLRPALIFQRSSATQTRRFFAGPFVPAWAARRSLVPVVPKIDGLAGQLLHADDMAQAYRLAIVNDAARGPFNIATGPPLDPARLAEILRAHPVPLPAAPVRALIALAWRARLQPVSPDWFDIVRGVPIMSTNRARDVLGWSATIPADEVLLELLKGMREHAGFPTPPLEADSGGPLRIKEFLTGVGGRSSTEVRD